MDNKHGFCRRDEYQLSSSPSSAPASAPSPPAVLPDLAASLAACECVCVYICDFVGVCKCVCVCVDLQNSHISSIDRLPFPLNHVRNPCSLTIPHATPWQQPQFGQKMFFRQTPQCTVVKCHQTRQTRQTRPSLTFATPQITSSHTEKQLYKHELK